MIRQFALEMRLRRSRSLTALLFLGILFLAGCGGDSKTYRGPFQLGIDHLVKLEFAGLEGKRVGLITNQTSVNREGKPTRQILHESPPVNLVALFTPEHGLDGTEKAGNEVATRIDPLTGLIAHSLYGDTRKPTPKQLEEVDVLLFDLQDIGCRSYTYLSTMGLAMEACGEQGKEFVVLDRPNPLGGLRVQGPPMEEEWRSFVGQFPISYVHGMTAGELAEMANENGWMNARCQLRVVPMRGWKRSMIWEDTGLNWIPSSPNIPKARSPFYYVATGIFGELRLGDVGTGTETPFEVVGGRNIDSEIFTQALREAPTAGITFEPYQNATKPEFRGSRLTIDPRAETDLPGLNVLFIQQLDLPVSQIFASADASPWKTFYKVYGSEGLKSDMNHAVSHPEIVASWKPFNEKFAEERAPFLRYP